MLSCGPSTILAPTYKKKKKKKNPRPSLSQTMINENLLANQLSQKNNVNKGVHVFYSWKT